MAYGRIAERLDRGDVIVLDGATGSELERRGALMDDGAWCALATQTHPGILRAVHDDFIRAGAEIITANTYATTHAMLEAAGALDRFESLVRDSVRIARESSDSAGRPVAVAGSMSVSRPVVTGSDRIAMPDVLDETLWRDRFRAKADLLADCGVDFILMEMMRDLDLSVWAVEAAVATGLPVWVGVSAERDAQGRLVGTNRQEFAAADLIATLTSLGGSVAGIMHTTVDDTDAALPLLRESWPGPVMAYPESGYFEAPHWNFVDIIPPAELAGRARAWLDQGVQVIGGCCGLGPDHVAALSALRDERRAMRTSE